MRLLSAFMIFLGINMKVRQLNLAGLAATLAIALSSAPALAAAKKKSSTPAQTAEEKLAESVWKLRAALNVAALQCQFDPNLKAVSNYNDINKIHKSEIEKSRTTMEGRYRKLYGRGGLGAFDRYNTKLWNGFSSVNHQVPFCNKASEVGKEVLGTPEGSLAILANNRVPEILAVFPAATPAVNAPVKKAIGKKTAKKKASRKKRK
jgi:hypothetical protein